MKYGKKTLMWHGLVVAMCIGGLLCTSSNAQEVLPTTEVATQAKAGELNLASKIAKYKVDISLTKPTPIKEFMELIQGQISTPLNMMLSRSASTLMVPPMELEQVSVRSALNAMIAATENEGVWDRMGWTLRQIGEKFGLKTGAVDGKIRRAIDNLKTRAERV